MAQSGPIGYARVVLGIDASQYRRDWQKLREEAQTKSLGKAISSGLKEGVDALKETGAQAGVVGRSLVALGGAGLAAGAAIGAVVEVLRQSREAIRFGDEIAAAAKKASVSTDALQEYRYAVHQLGGTFTDADVALQQFTQKFGLAQASFSKRATKPFDALGLDAKTFGTAEEALQAVIAKIAALKSAAEQAGIADKLGLTTMLPAIRAGADRINELREAAHQLGIVMDAALVEKAEESNKKFEALGQVINVQFKSAFVEAAPAIIEVTQAIADLVTWMAKLAEGPAFRLLAAGTGGLVKGGLIGGVVAAYRTGGQMLKDDADLRKYGPLPKSYGEADDPLLMQQRAAASASRTGELISQQPRTGPKPDEVRKASEAAIEAATKAELEAQLALTADVAQIAALKAREVEGERKAANTRLEIEAHEGKITAAARDIAIDKNNQAADEKQALIRLEAQAQADKALLADKQEIDRYLSQKAGLEASAAKTAAARGAIELADLKQRQRLEAQALADEVADKTARDAKYASTGKLLLAAQAEAQAAEVGAQAQRTSAAIQAEANASAEAALELQIDILRSQGALAKSDGARMASAEAVLKLEQQLERLKLEEVVASVTATDVEKQIAQTRLGQLDAMQSNDLTAKRMADFNQSLDTATGAADSFASAIKSNDVPGAIAAFAKALKSFAGSNGPLATFGEDLTVLLAVYQGGSSLGSSLASAVGGDQKVGHDVGGLLGGIPGAIASLFGSNTAKKKAEAEAAAKAQTAAEAAAAHAQDVANERRVLEIDLLRAQGDAEGALNLERQAELAALDQSNRALEQQLFDLADAAAKAQQAATVAAQAHDLQLQLLDLTGDATGALAATRAAELAGIDAANRGLQLEIYNLKDYASAQDEAAKATQDAAAGVAAAQDALTHARDAEAAAINDTLQKYQGYLNGLVQFRDSLAAQTAPASASSYGALSAQLANAGSLIALGNQDALGAFPALGQQFVSAAKASAHNAVEFNRDLAKVRDLTQRGIDTASRQVSLAQQQLTALNSEVDGILKVDASVKSVEQAIRDLQDALKAQADAGPAALAEALARFTAAEGSNIVPLAPPPAVSTGGTALLDGSAPSPVDAGNLDALGLAPAVAQAIADNVADQLNPALAAIVGNTGATKEWLQQFNDVGMPTVAA